MTTPVLVLTPQPENFEESAVWKNAQAEAATAPVLEGAPVEQLADATLVVVAVESESAAPLTPAAQADSGPAKKLRKDVKPADRLLEFLATIQKHWQERLGKPYVSCHDKTLYAYDFLVKRAKGFEPGELADEELDKAIEAFVGDLYKMLTEENAEWLTGEIKYLLPKFAQTDERKVFVEACLLVAQPAEERHTVEWVTKAEKARVDLKKLALLDKLVVALAPFEGREDEFVVKARALLTNTSGKWFKKVHEAIRVLQENKPKDMLAEADWFRDRIALELKGLEKDNRLAFYDAKQLLEVFGATSEWVALAEKSLMAVRTEKTFMAARKSLKWWLANLSAEVKQEPVEALKKALDDQDVVAVGKALEALKYFKPICTEPGCTKHVGREDDGKGRYFPKCRDHKPAQAISDLHAPATEAQLLKLKRVHEEGDPVPVMEVDPGFGIRTDKNGGRKRKVKKVKA